VIWLSRLGWTALVIVTVAIAASVYLVRLPNPTGVLIIDQTRFLPTRGEAKDISLPNIWFPLGNRKADQDRYTTHFNLTELPRTPLFLFIPIINRSVTVAVNGESLFESEARALWSGPLLSSSVLLQLPNSLLVKGRNEMTLVVDTSQFIIPGYLSKMYVGAEEQVAPYFKLRVFLEDRLKTMALAAHVLLGLGLIFPFFSRPKDRLFAWLAAMVWVSFPLSMAMFIGFQPGIQNILPYIASLSPSLGLLSIGLALSIVGLPTPRILPIAVVVVPAMAVLLVSSGLPHARPIVTLVNLPILIGAFFTSTGVVAWGAFRDRNSDARLMLAPFFLLCWFLIHDIGVALNLLHEPFVLLLPYVRPVLLAAITAVLMRRLAQSLDRLDSANENLNRRLAAREAELAALHAEERQEAARLVREHERQRLTHDLHDGISGHLVSIIAMSERAGGEAKPIEQAARGALDDLRLVIYSLDLGDRELPLALANFRERLIPQLQRIGVVLDWSTANLPEVSGVTPGNALSILRILQEAITNALKHGPARKIAVRGHAAADDMVAISIENDGCPFVAGKAGFGLDNMRRRAHELCGDIRIEPLEHGTRLTLLLPLCLPDFQVGDAEDIRPVRNGVH
jgi:signal transduction histidine kinase